MIDLERIERKERKKGADPPDHPRAKGSRWSQASIGVPYHRCGVESYLVLARSLQELTHHKTESRRSQQDNEMRVARPLIYSDTQGPQASSHLAQWVVSIPRIKSNPPLLYTLI